MASAIESFSSSKSRGVDGYQIPRLNGEQTMQ
jgi:hypothetical protein